jgi:hypothetical protein
MGNPHALELDMKKDTPKAMKMRRFGSFSGECYWIALKFAAVIAVTRLNAIE